MSGGGEDQNFKTDDLQYVRDLGLISQKGMAIANPIYQEIIPRELSYTKQESIAQNPALYKKNDGSLNINALMLAFTQFYRENSAIWLEKFEYKESGPHLLLLAFLQSIINGGGTIHREYALGRKRVDLLITWPNNSYMPITQQRIVIELKLWHSEKTILDGLNQTADYMNSSNATEGHLVVFNRDPNLSWNEKIFHEQRTTQNYSITIWGM
jgi:hypothetical protein